MASKYIKGHMKNWPQVSAKIEPDLEKEIRALATIDGNGMSDVIREAIVAGMSTVRRRRVRSTSQRTAS